ncbi:YgfZ/GcvT domain-containing protein [Calditrichota bacterium]
MKNLYLNKFHSQSGANFAPIENYKIPTDYGNVEDELFAINNKVALLDRSYLGKSRMIGKDSLDLLDRITTNDLQYLSIGTVCDTVFVTPKGRIIDWCRILNSGESEYILIGSSYNSKKLVEWVNRFIILEDTKISDITDKYTWLTLIGPHCKLFLSEYSETPISNADEAIWLNYEGMIFPAFKNTNFLVPAYNFCFEHKFADKIFNSFLKTLTDLNGKLIGDTAFQITRIESGMPEGASEINMDYNPHEARLINSVSFTKGCYTGQEVIARLDTYDKVQKYLMIIDLFERIENDPPLEVYIEDDLIGYLTSHAFNPATGNFVGLGYVKKMYTGENNIYVEISTPDKRIPAKLRKPPQAY